MLAWILLSNKYNITSDQNSINNADSNKNNDVDSSNNSDSNSDGDNKGNNVKIIYI